MPKTAAARKNRFRKALIDAGLSAAAWARQEGVTPAHLSQVLDGKRESQRLVDRIDAFVKQTKAVA